MLSTAQYMAIRIIEGAYTYEYIISKKPSLKDGIDAYLVEQGRDDLIES